MRIRPEMFATSSSIRVGSRRQLPFFMARNENSPAIPNENETSGNTHSKFVVTWPTSGRNFACHDHCAQHRTRPAHRRLHVEATPDVRRRPMGGRAVRPPLRHRRPRHRAGHHDGSAERPRGRRTGRAGRAASVRQRAVAGDDACRTAAHGVADRRGHHGASRRLRAAGDHRQRQVGRGRAGGRRHVGRRDLLLLRGLGHQDRGQDHPGVGAVGAGQPVPRVHAARAGRGVRADRAVELPARHGRVQGGARRWRVATPSSSSPPSRPR